MSSPSLPRHDERHKSESFQEEEETLNFTVQTQWSLLKIELYLISVFSIQSYKMYEHQVIICNFFSPALLKLLLW